MYALKLFTGIAIAATILLSGCKKEDFSATGGLPRPQMSVVQPVNLGSAESFAVLGGTTVTNAGASIIEGDLGVSPGTAITGFQQSPMNTISGPGTVTAGLGIVTGTIYAGGPVAAQAHNDAVLAYNYLVAQTPDTTYAGVTQFNGITFTPGVYRFAPSANLQVNGTVYLDFQGNSDAVFIFQFGTTLVTMTGSNVIAINNGNDSCVGPNVYWAVGSSATIDGNQFIGTVIANTSISMTSGSNVNCRIIALNGAVTLIENEISACGQSSGGPRVENVCTTLTVGAPALGSCATISADTAASGLTYAWSTGATTQAISVCPTATTTYSVTISAGNQPVVIKYITVNYWNIRCTAGNSPQHKVMVCHRPPGNPTNEQNICIDWSGVPAHVARFRAPGSNPNQGHDSGCEIGNCAGNPCQ